MSREADVVQSLVEFADTLVADYDVVDLLTGLADGVDMAEAFNRLRNYARDNNLHLTAVAQAAIDGTLDVKALAPAPRRPARQHE